MAHADPPPGQVALLDAGAGRRLERFGAHVVDRPQPGALVSPAAPGRWREADLRFDRDLGWSGSAAPAEPWTVETAGLTLELRATESGGVGLFPEQLANVGWLEAQVVATRLRRSSTSDGGADRPAVLNLFAHTGLLTLVAARTGAAVAHVDASRPAVAWARRNAELAGLADAPIRWLVDDAPGFVEREIRRGRRYDGILLDPPTYGHGGRGAWRLDADLAGLLTACAGLAREGAFLLLTAHAAGLDESALAGMVRAAWRGRAADLDNQPLELVAISGVRLWLGAAVRIDAAPARPTRA